MDANTRTRILTEARSWLGTAYHHKAKVKGVGCDCGTFLHAVYGMFFPLKAFPDDYAADWAMHTENDPRYLDFLAEYVVPVDGPVPAGLVVFRWGVAYSHGGICTEAHKVIHAYGRTTAGCVRENHLMAFRGVPRKFFDIKPLVEAGL